MLSCRWALLATIAFVTGVGGLLSVILLYTLTGGKIPFDYGIVVDAGSSHSEAFLYKWLGNKDHGTADAHQADSSVVEGGISSAKNVDGMLSSVRSVVRNVPSSFRSQTSLYLVATAGMRLLNLTSPREAELILMSLHCPLRESGTDLKEVTIISGHDEGLFSWITTNYLAKTLHRNPGVWNETFGALDLGGASTQFAYAVDSATRDPAKAVDIHLFGANYSIVARSYLCYGLEQAFLRHHTLLIQDLNSNESVVDPCLPEGYNVTYEAEDLLNQPCTVALKFEKWLLDDVRHKTKIFVFEGSSDYQTCQGQVSAQLNHSMCKSAGLNICVEPLNNTYFSKQKYKAFSSFFYVTSFLNSTEASMDDLRSVLHRWCHLMWPQIVELHYKKSYYVHLMKYCFGGNYLLKWLTTIYGFNEETWKNIDFQHMVGKTQIGWALGYMINATNAMQEKSATPPVLPRVTFITLSTLCVTLTVVFVVLVVKLCKIRSQRPQLDRTLLM